MKFPGMVQKHLGFLHGGETSLTDFFKTRFYPNAFLSLLADTLYLGMNM